MSAIVLAPIFLTVLLSATAGGEAIDVPAGGVVTPDGFELRLGLDRHRNDGLDLHALRGAAEAVDLVGSKRGADGRWLLDVRYPGTMPIDLDEAEGRPSRWVSLRALRVLDWYAGG
jgi:hypothetical protein